MAKIINFPRLKIGQIVRIEFEGDKIKCIVVKHEGNNVYKVKALEGRYKGYTAHYKLVDIIRS